MFGLLVREQHGDDRKGRGALHRLAEALEGAKADEDHLSVGFAISYDHTARLRQPKLNVIPRSSEICEGVGPAPMTSAARSPGLS